MCVLTWKLRSGERPAVDPLLGWMKYVEILAFLHLSRFFCIQSETHPLTWNATRTFGRRKQAFLWGFFKPRSQCCCLFEMSSLLGWGLARRLSTKTSTRTYWGDAQHMKLPLAELPSKSVAFSLGLLSWPTSGL